MYRKEYKIKNSFEGNHSLKSKRISETTFKIGEIEHLKVIREKDFGVYLGHEDSNEHDEAVLLPKNEATGLKVGDEVNVFIYRDSDDRVIATKKTPAILLNQVKPLMVKEVNKVGAFLDWGLSKDLFLPYKEMLRKVKEGDTILVKLYIDKSNRIAASMKDLWKLLSTNSPYQRGDVVKGRVYELGKDFGTFVAVDDKYSAMLPKFEKTKKLSIGDEIMARVIAIKEDGKIDITMREDAYKEIESDSEIILKLLNEYAGVLPFTEKASPEVILRETGLSKNAFKRAVGHLYKERKIIIQNSAIRLSKWIVIYV